MKKQIRKQILSQRETLPDNEVSKKSQIIFQKLKNFTLYKNSENVMVYIDFRNEVKTDLIINDLLLSGKKVFIPVSIPKTKEILLSEIIDPKKELEKGTYGVLEPKEIYIRERDPKILDLIVVPGVAFSRQGYRIGYGAGYYDRFFSSIKKRIPSVGLAFDMQIIDSFTPDPHDHSLDYIITETQIISVK